MNSPIDALKIISQQYLPAIEEHLVHSLTRASTNQSEVLHDMLAYHMGWQGEGAGAEARGKRIRPLLVLLSNAAAGGDWERGLPAASAVELVHNFSLIHDDIEDNSPLRRGRLTVWKLWGIPQAINAGDAMFALAHLEILRLQETTSASIAIQAVRLLLNTCLRLTQGQYLDLSYENRPKLSLDDYWLMIAGKTATLIATCARLGALIAGGSEELQELYWNFGRTLGLAFQVQDDLLGIWGEAELTGKSATSDLVTGKKSLPILFGLSQKGMFAQRWLQGPINEEEGADVARLLEQDGGRAYAEKIAEQLTNQALETMEQAQLEGLAGSALRQLTNQLLNRKV